MKVPRICMNPGCKYVMKAKELEYTENKEENTKLDILDANKHCPKCNSKLTKYAHKVFDKIKDDEDLCKLFGVTDKKATEAKQAVYKEAVKQTEAQLRKDIEETKRMRGN